MHRNRLPRHALGAAALTLTFALTGCTGGFGGGDGGGDSQDQQAQPAESGAAVSGEPGSAEAAGIDPNNVPDPIATGEVPAAVEGDPDATMTVEFYGLYRDGKTVVGQFAFTVNSESSQDPAWLYHYLGDSTWTPFLVDSQNLKKHNVLRDTTGVIRPQTDSQGAKFLPGQKFYAFAVFAAPPEDVTTVNVAPVDGMAIVQDVEIQ